MHVIPHQIYLTRYGEQNINLVDTETSILSVLTRLGFNTVVWMGTQSITKYCAFIIRNKVRNYTNQLR